VWGGGGNGAPEQKKTFQIKIKREGNGLFCDLGGSLLRKAERRPNLGKYGVARLNPIHREVKAQLRQTLEDDRGN